MRILHTLDNSNRGGIQELILNLHRYSSHTHEFSAADGSMAEEIRAAGMTLWNTFVPNENSYDVVVGHTVGGWDGKPGAEFAHSMGAKFVECMHSLAISPTDPELVDGFIALSEGSKSLNLKFRNPVAIYGILDASTFRPYDPDSRLIGRLSRLASEKNPLDFMILARNFPQERFICGGDGNLMAEMRERAVPNMDLPGWIHDKPTFYHNLRLFVFSTYDECCCMSVAQAQAAGVPVICSDTPALRETTGGFASLQRDVVGMAGVLRRFLDDEEFRAGMYSQAALAREWAREKFDKSVTIPAWDTYLESL